MATKKYKKRCTVSRTSFSVSNEERLVASSGCEALAAVYSLALGRIEGNLAFLTAVSTDGGEHLARTLRTVLASITACLATLGLVLEALLSVEFLLTGGEHEIVAAILALQCLVLIHVFYLTWYFFAPRRIPTDAFDNNALP